MSNRMKRREILQSVLTSAGAAAVGNWPAWMPRLAFAPGGSAPRGDVLLVIYLRGAADALNLVIPFGERRYYELRPTLGISPPDSGTEGKRAVNLDGFFGLHPVMAPLKDAWSERQLAIIHACGAPDESRSHFKAMALMERGVQDESGPASGWISRHLASHDTGNSSPLRALGLGAQPQRSLRGSVPITTLRSITDFHYDGNEHTVVQMKGALGTLYDGADSLSVIGRETLVLLETLQTLDPETYHPAGERAYPEGDFGAGLKQVAMLVKADVGVEVAAIDLGGWDTHFAQGGSEGLLANLASELAQGLAALHADLHDHFHKVSVVVMTEFGRRARENGSLGTDHGHGGVMLLLGGNLNGGRVYGKWPGLAPEQLVGPGDLAVTTDYRDVLAEVCAKRLGNTETQKIFPGYQPATINVFQPMA